MTLDELQEIVNGTWIRKPKQEEIQDFSIDTRTLKKKDVYIALKGERLDGHSFLKDADNKKALLAIVSEKPKEKIKHMGILLVEDTQSALNKLAIYKRKQFQIPLIAVTGSVGKTTLKELISSVLNPDYKVLKSAGNQNNHIGLPLTLLKLNKEYDVIVTELGMNHSGEIGGLSKICTPNISLITNIGTSHIGYLGSRKNIFKAKMEICNGMESGTLIVNGCDKYLRKVKSTKEITCLKCGGKHAEISIGKANITERGTTFPIYHHKKKYLVEFPYPGKHYPTLIAMAILVGLQMDIDIETCIQRVKQFEMLERRLNITKLKNNITLIDDSYNASLESFTSAFELIKKDKRPKLLIVGDILELGNHTRKIHLKLIKRINKMKNTEVWLAGNELEKLQKHVHMGTFFPSVDKMQKSILENNWKDCIILVKGSNAIGLGEVSKQIKDKYKVES